MTSEPSSSPGPSSSPVNPLERIRHFPDDVRASFVRYQTTGDVAALDPVIYAILNDYIPNKPEQPLSSFPGSTLLIEGLGFDSLAITEVVFFTEELLGITIANEEILQVRTLDDLRGFVHAKAPGRKPV
ncbi:MAG TPA: acyl carrier protein [Opitutaceae bacterium]|nr:acyl carrier protein [Opitutaceae bacterium]